ncbi:MAG: hypothetical protein ABI565_14255 [Vicinamibacteria bacterium]
MIVLAAVLVLSGVRWFNDITHRAKYYSYLDRSLIVQASDGAVEKEQARAWLASHHGLFLDEGEAACDWLKRQPELTDAVAGGSADSRVLAALYVQQTTYSTQTSLPDHARGRLANAAWDTLCRSVGDSHITPVLFIPDEEPTGGD